MSNLQWQLETTPHTWQAILEAGYKPGDKVELDFLYYAPSRARAKALAKFIASHSDAIVGVKTRGLFRRCHMVDGRVPSRPIDEPFLLEWVRWMVEIGERHDCEFDGWSAGPI